MRRSHLPELEILWLGGGLHLVWEIAHSPFYADFYVGVWHLIWTRLHCTVGDVLIMLGAFWATSLLVRSRKWLPAYRPVPVASYTLLSLGYTVFSEWRNVQVLRSWEYSGLMPELWGIGLTPVLQWLIVPPLVAYLAHFRRTSAGPGKLPPR